MSYSPPPPPGMPPYQGYHGMPPQAPKTNGMAIAGFVLSFFCSLLGLIFSGVALSQIGKTGEGGKGLAIAGLVISVIGMLFWLLIWGSAANSSGY